MHPRCEIGGVNKGREVCLAGAQWLSLPCAFGLQQCPWQHRREQGVFPHGEDVPSAAGLGSAQFPGLQKGPAGL